LTLALLTSFATSCGGGRVDPEFTDPIEVQPSTRALPHDVVARGIDSSPATAFVKPKLVVIRADWCGYCRTAQPGIDAAYDAYRAKVDLVVLDVTDESSTREAARIAAHEGVRRFFSSYQGRTPTVGVFVGPEDGRLVHGTLEDPELLSRELSFAVEQFRTVR
jgi:thiol-disulfide isomerase/thioredoxin